MRHPGGGAPVEAERACRTDDPHCAVRKVADRARSMNKATGWKCEIMLCLLPLIENGRASFQIVALAADAIAACARFNIWVHRQERRSGEWNEAIEANWLRLLDLYNEATIECKAAVRRLDDGGDREALANRLQRIIEKLNQRPDLTRPISEETK